MRNFVLAFAHKRAALVSVSYDVAAQMICVRATRNGGEHTLRFTELWWVEVERPIPPKVVALWLTHAAGDCEGC